MDKKDLPPLNAHVFTTTRDGQKEYTGIIKDAHMVYMKSEPFTVRELATLWGSQHLAEARDLQHKYFSRTTIKVATLQFPSITAKDLRKLTGQ